MARRAAARRATLFLSWEIGSELKTAGTVYYDATDTIIDQVGEASFNKRILPVMCFCSWQILQFDP